MNVPRYLHDRAIRFQVQTLRYAAGEQRKIRALLNKIQEDILDQMRKARIDDAVRAETKAKRLATLFEEVKIVLNTEFKVVNKVMRTDLAALARIAAEDASASINAIFGGVELAQPNLSASFMKSIAKDLIFGTPADEWWEQQANSTRNRFMQQLRLGLAQGETVDEMVTRVVGRAARDGRPAIAGVMDLTRQQAEMLVRTAVVSTSNRARQESLNDENMVKGWQWVSTLDSRTTPICRALDGKQWDKEYNPIGHDMAFPGPVAHIGCRSTQIPVLVSYSELVEDKEVAAILDTLSVDNSTRASMGGQVDGGMNYDQWLKEMEAEKEGFAKDMLGPARYDLWKKGKLSMEDMVGQNGRELTLEELEALIKRNRKR